jgi:hypothetical protein
MICEQWLETRVQALLEAVENYSPERKRPRDLLGLLHSLKLIKAYGIDGISNECLRHFQEDHWYI